MKDYLLLSNGCRVEYRVYSSLERRVVVVVAHGCSKLAVKGYSRIYRSVYAVLPRPGSRLFKDLLMKDVYIGRARCNLEDDFNVLAGREIAVSRLKEKLESAVSRREALLARELRRMASSLDGF